MKRGRKSLNNTQESETNVTEQFVKSTYLLDPILKENLQYLALHQRREQSDLVREAISEYLVAKGLNPKARPIFTFNPQ